MTAERRRKIERIIDDKMEAGGSVDEAVAAVRGTFPQITNEEILDALKSVAEDMCREAARAQAEADALKELGTFCRLARGAAQREFTTGEALKYLAEYGNAEVQQKAKQYIQRLGIK